MDDTDKKTREMFHKMLMKKSGIERLMISFSMFDSAKKIVKTSILKCKPYLSEKNLRLELFMRFYDMDFKGHERDKIIKYLKKL